MFIYRIRSKALKAEGHKYESHDPRRAANKLAEVQLRDPKATLIKIPVGQR